MGTSDPVTEFASKDAYRTGRVFFYKCGSACSWNAGFPKHPTHAPFQCVMIVSMVTSTHLYSHFRHSVNILRPVFRWHTRLPCPIMYLRKSNAFNWKMTILLEVPTKGILCQDQTIKTLLVEDSRNGHEVFFSTRRALASHRCGNGLPRGWCRAMQGIFDTERISCNRVDGPSTHTGCASFHRSEH